MKLHIVRPGDTLRKIARRFDIPVQRLVEVNPSLDPERPKPGAKVKIPGGKVPVTCQRKGKAKVTGEKPKPLSRKSESGHPESGKDKESPESPEEQPLPKGPYGWDTGKVPSPMIPPMPKAPEYRPGVPAVLPLPPSRFIPRKGSSYMQPIPYPLPPMGVPCTPQQHQPPMQNTAVPAPGYGSPGQGGNGQRQLSWPDPGYGPSGRGENGQRPPWWPIPGFGQPPYWREQEPQQGRSWPPWFPVPYPWWGENQLPRRGAPSQRFETREVAKEGTSVEGRRSEGVPPSEDLQRSEREFASLLSEEETPWEESSGEK